MENVLLIDVHVNHVKAALDLIRNIILNRADLMVNEQLASARIPCKTTHPVIHRHNVRIKGVDQIIQCLKW
ncbi:hypothetical protein D3C75_1326970 [compost metagenome]